MPSKMQPTVEPHVQPYSQWQVGFLNLGHFVDHLVILLFPALAALILEKEWNMSYASLIALATPGLAAFGFASMLAGWLGDIWNRQGMLLVFFFGIGAACIGAGLANNPFQMAGAVFAIGFFASIYHPVGLAMLVERQKRLGMSLALNGMFGNVGVASAALLAGWLIQHSQWRMVFFGPAMLCIGLGLGYGLFLLLTHPGKQAAAVIQTPQHHAAKPDSPTPGGAEKRMLLKGFAVSLLVGAFGAMVFQSTTLSLPRLFAERLSTSPSSSFTQLAALAGYWSFGVLVFAALGQLATGVWIDRGTLRKALVVVVGVQVPLLWLLSQSQGVMVVLAAAAAMFFVFGQIPLNDALIVRIVQNSWRSRAYAMKYVVSFSAASLAAPLIASLHAWQGFTVLYAILGGCAAFGLLAALSLPKALL